MRPIIALLTDFGLTDACVGTMKGVILDINRDAQIVDLSHDVSPQNVEQAAYLMKSAHRYFPAGTVYVAVVDPGVGTARRAVAAEIGRWIFVAPDNGVLTHIIRAEGRARTFEIRNPRFMLPEVSRTFHARDVFAPAAAYISLGTPISEMGPAVEHLVLLPPPPGPDGDAYAGKVIHVDRFGNCITDIEEAEFRRWARGGVKIEAAGWGVRGPVGTYGDAAAGEAVALFGSSGHLEIAVGTGNAAVILGLTFGSRVSAYRCTG